MEPKTDDAGAPRDETFPKSDRICRRPEFQRVQSQGERVHATHFLVMVLARTDEQRRIGITVTKKVGNAVHRNRVKRVMREVFRRNRELFPEGADIVVIAKHGAPRLGYAEAVEQMTRIGKALRSARLKSHEKRRRLDDSGVG
ncbi:MAG: ribonuclease P protein component [Polyangiaceae bacterium]|nr:ribonuclease P protein component [Polyangiaceae bacterium]